MMSFNAVARLIRRRELSKLLHLNLKCYPADSTCINNFQYARFIHRQYITNLSTYCQRFYSVKAAQQESDDNNYRTENNVTVLGEDVPSPYTDIDLSPFPDYIKNYIKEQGITKPTVIQSQGWPIALSGKNFVGIAQTGTGKTLAYLLPAIVHIKEKQSRKGKGPVVLVLAPTRELARQIEEVAKVFQKLLRVRCVCLYGGVSRNPQAAELQAGVDLVIATPGRLNDFLISKVTTLSRCTYVVLDEADRMLDMGFEPQIRQALEGVPLERQILMFSATWPKEVRHLAKDYLGQYVQVNVGSTDLSANHNIQQHIHICEPEDKMEKFNSIMHDVSGSGMSKVLVFANTKKFVDTLTLMLKRNGYPAVGIHGDKTQLQRDIVINKFKRGQVNILVATDVAARGLDVDGISHVINYDFPNTSEDYIHRIGRTGRQDNKGQSHTILTSDDERQAKSLISVLKEAKQEVPKELDDMARSFALSNVKDQQASRYTRGSKQPWNANKRWNNYRSSSERNYNYNSYNKMNNYEKYDNEGNFRRSPYRKNYNNNRNRNYDGYDEDKY